MHPAINDITWSSPTQGIYSGYFGTKNYTPSSVIVRQDMLSASQKSPPDTFGWRKPTPYNGVKSQRQLSLVSGQSCQQGKYWTRVANHSYFGPAIPSISSFNAEKSALLSEARMKALGKFSQASVDLSVAFLERKKTASMAVDCMTGLVDFYRDLRRGRVPRALKDWRDVPGKWLMYRYGITPTILDVYGALEALEHAEQGTFNRYLVTAHGKAELVVPGTSTGPSSWFNISRYGVLPAQKRSRVAERKATAKVRIDATLDASWYRSLSDVGLTNPLVTAWELVPYSFVVDWFVGVGDFLGAVNALQGYTWKATSETYHTAYEAEDVITPASPGYPYSDTSFSVTGGGPTKLEFFSRSVPTSPPSASINIKRNPLDLTRFADGLSLLSQVFGKRGR